MDTLTEIMLWHATDLVLLTALLVFVLMDHRLYGFVKGQFLVACLIGLMGEVLGILLYRVQIIELVEQGPTLIVFSQVTYWYAWFLMLLGLTMLIGRAPASTNAPEVSTPLEGQRRHIGISLLLFLVTLGIYYPFWLYRTVKDLRTNFAEDIPYSPARAVGFLFIPIFNIGWALYLLFSLPARMSLVERKHFDGTVGFRFRPVLIPILQILLGVAVYLPHSGSDIRVSVLSISSIGAITLLLVIQAKLNAFFDAGRAARGSVAAAGG